jgi:hypothetical protein
MLHDVNAIAFYAPSARCIIGSLFCTETVNSNRYAREMLQTFFRKFPHGGKYMYSRFLDLLIAPNIP